MTSGFVGVGDSLMNGHGNMQLGVQCQSWALWLSEAADMAFRKYSVGGSTSQRIVDEQLPRLTGRHRLAAVCAGANDVLSDWDSQRLLANLDRIVNALSDVAERVVIVNLPAVLGQLPGAAPTLAARTAEANDHIGEVAARRGVLLIDVAPFEGQRMLRADRVHPTALGQLAIADRAAELLGVPTKPSSLSLGRPEARLPVGHSVGFVRQSAYQTARSVGKRALRR